MMTCEKCEKEMQGNVVQCPHCQHNHVLQRIDAWRERRNHQISSLNRRHSELPAQASQQGAGQSLRATAKDSTLIRFPKRPIAPSAPTAPPEENVESLPAWRQRLEARLKEIREQRALDIEPPAPPRAAIKPERNPLIESALNRIQRANYLQPITPPSRSRYAVAADLAPEPSSEPVVTAVINQPVSRAAEVQAPIYSSALPHTLTVSLLEPQIEPEITVPTEDLLSEITLEAIPERQEDKAAEADILPSSATTLEAASLAKRAAAAVIDGEIIAFSLLPLFAIYFFLGGWFETPGIYTPGVVGILLVTAYFFVTYALAGRTMGMAFLNLHLASQSQTSEATAPSTTTFTFQQAALRALGGTISLLLFPLNILCIAKSDERLSISDYLSGTQVVKIKK
jgi:uncharacterized RDD family membrane protein YckC/uncharacterized Zn finger protein (UPF0148 family)